RRLGSHGHEARPLSGRKLGSRRGLRSRRTQRTQLAPMSPVKERLKMSHEETFFPDRKRPVAALCQACSERIAEPIRKRRKASLALAGGTTPGPLYEALSNLPLNWEKVSVTLTDERWVSPEDPASNEWLIRDLLLKRRAHAATFVPFKTNHARATGGAVV